jgi:putative transposase
MARIARVVVPGCWHHATQRGNHQQTVFFEDSDRRFYLELLRHHCSRHGVRIAGYCLMNNHVHLLAIPEAKNGLARALGRAHNDYARWLNLRRRETGHVWQNRFYSCPLDGPHQWDALRYVELNPVRAGLVPFALEWRWSSATAHVSGPDQTGWIDRTDWCERWSRASWDAALRYGIQDTALLDRIRSATRTGRPAGSEDFLKRAEASAGRPLRVQKPGPAGKLVVV